MHKQVMGCLWSQFTRALAEKIVHPRFAGVIQPEEALGKNMRFVTGEKKDSLGAIVRFTLLVDEWDGGIADVRFQAFGPPALNGIAEAFCEILIRKNYDQAKRLDAEWIDKQLRDKKDKEALPQETHTFVNLVLDAVEDALQECEGISLPEEYIVTPVQAVFEGGPYPGWDELSQSQQIAVLEQLLSSDIRPYIELDAGGIEIVSLTEGRELVIAYRGACITCPSSVGSTLQAVQQILTAKIHPEIRVVPDHSFFTRD
ncbi:MAG: [Fe-S]-binding protein [Chlamydiae bacterium]|nr:[Fe-S]-binding protein [Chlamydiota bacterium]